MQPLSGLELAEYLEKLFQSLPMILLTQFEDMDFNLQLIPASVVDTYPSSHDAHIVLERAILALQQAREITSWPWKEVNPYMESDKKKGSGPISRAL
jgi:hypothetical protein